MMEENQRIRFLVYDALVEQKIDPAVAAPIAQQVGTALRHDETVDKLYVVRITDSGGTPHDCVVSKLTDSSIVLAPVDVAGLRAMARQQIVEERAVDDRLQDGGTEV